MANLCQHDPVFPHCAFEQRKKRNREVLEVGMVVEGAVMSHRGEELHSEDGKHAQEEKQKCHEIADAAQIVYDIGQQMLRFFQKWVLYQIEDTQYHWYADTVNAVGVDAVCSDKNKKYSYRDGEFKHIPNVDVGT